MPFVRIEGEEGLFYVPEDDGLKKKHPCKDCFCCQWCDDERCAQCLKRKCCDRHNESGDEV
jgi:hypothetical protein